MWPDLDDNPLRGRRRVTGVRCALGLDQQNVRLFVGDRTVFDSLGNDVDLAGPKFNVAVSQLDGQAPLQNHEEVIRVFMLVPLEGAFDLDDHEIVAVELSDRPGLVVLREGCELFREIDGGHGGCGIESVAGRSRDRVQGCMMIGCALCVALRRRCAVA